MCKSLISSRYCAIAPDSAEGWIELKILGPARGVRVRFPSSALCFLIFSAAYITLSLIKNSAALPVLYPFR